MEYARFADDLVILVDHDPRWDWLLRAVEKRLREELAKLEVVVNEEKTRNVDLRKGESFGFLGFEFRLVKTRKGKWRPFFSPKMKKRAALTGKLREVFWRFRSQPVARVIEIINPTLRGWVNYFRVGDASRCFSYIRQWVLRKIRRHLRKNQKRRGLGWKKWSNEWLIGKYGIFADYRLSRGPALAKAFPS